MDGKGEAPADAAPAGQDALGDATNRDAAVLREPNAGAKQPCMQLGSIVGAYMSLLLLQGQCQLQSSLPPSNGPTAG
jgi:hypothetical protein